MTHNNHLNHLIHLALKEDIGKRDITTHILFDQNQRSLGKIIFKEEGILCGMGIVREIFKTLDPHVRIRQMFKDGHRIKKNTVIALIYGRTQSLLTAERVALNFLSRLSGIATLTHTFVQKIKPYPVQLLDTRKTSPGLRILEKYAVRCGGGRNHRENLEGMILIKDNHLRVLKKKKDIHDIIGDIRRRTTKPIEIEVEHLSQFQQILLARPDMILLDNMSPQEIRKAVYQKNRLIGRKPILEVSGGINLKNIRNYAKTGVDRISIGALTHSVKAIDISLEIVC